MNYAAANVICAALREDGIAYSDCGMLQSRVTTKLQKRFHGIARCTAVEWREDLLVHRVYIEVKYAKLAQGMTWSLLCWDADRVAAQIATEVLPHFVPPTYQVALPETRINFEHALELHGFAFTGLTVGQPVLQAPSSEHARIGDLRRVQTMRAHATLYTGAYFQLSFAQAFPYSPRELP